MFRVTNLRLFVRCNWPSLVDCLSVNLHPRSHLFHNFDSFRRDLPVTIHTHVQQEISSLTDNVHKVMHQFPGRLILITRQIRPLIGHRHTRFPRVLPRLFGNLLFRGTVVLVLPSNPAIHDNQAGLIPPGHINNPIHFNILSPILRGHPSPVQPDNIYIPVTSHQFLHLIISKVAEFLPHPRVFLDLVIHVTIPMLPAIRPIIRAIPIRL